MGADAEVIDRWWHALLADDRALPHGLVEVQGRLIRRVARGELPSGPVFVKWMAFPRAKDKLRYCARALPAVHEARMLELVARLGVPCPEVVAVRTARARLLPRASLLVLRALPVGTAEVSAERELHERAALAHRLLQGGILHPDLNAGNFVRLADGGLAVLDLQSARVASPARCARARVAVAARLLRDSRALAGYSAENALLGAGLLPDLEAMARARLRAAADDFAFLRGRVRRCLRESTEFAVAHTLGGTHCRRRECTGPLVAVRGGRDLLECWLGDRAREVLEGQEPQLGALFRRWPVLPGASAVYFAHTDEPLDVPRALATLRAAYERHRVVIDGGRARRRA